LWLTNPLNKSISVKIIFKIILSFLLIFFLGGKIYGQIQSINFKHLTINEGLSQNTVYCTFQDKKGFIWVGTEDGLNRFDGVDWLIFKHELSNKHSLSNNQVNDIVQADDGKLIIATADGLNIYDPAKDVFNRVNLHTSKDQINEFVSSVFRDSKGRFWIGSRDGLKLMNQQKTAIQKSFSFNTNKGRLNPEKILNTFESNNGQLWVNTGTGLKLFNLKTLQFEQLPASISNNKALNEGNVRVIKQDNINNFWFGTETNGLFYYDIAKQTIINYRNNPDINSIVSNVVRDIFFYSPTEIWIGTRDGLSILKLETQRFNNYAYDKYNPNSLSHNSVRNFLRDNAGSIWLGTYAGGLNIFYESSRNFNYLGEKLGNDLGLNHRVVSAINQETDGSLWVGTEGGGLNYIDRNKNISRFYPIINLANNGSNIVKCLVDDGKGKIWLGTYNGISIFDKKSQTFSGLFKSSSDLNSSQSYQIHDLVLDGNTSYIATNGKGLIIQTPTETQQLIYNRKDKSTICSNNLTTLLKVGNSLWIGSQRGLNRYNINQKTFTRFLNKENDLSSLSANSILCLFNDKDGNLWVGTEGGGINYYDAKNNKFKAISTTNGLANDVVHGLIQDNDGFLWASTNKGISKINIQAYFKDSAQVHIVNYNVSDGLQSNQFSNEAVAKGINGELLFGGINGITSFFPAKIKANEFKPRVVLTDFFIRNKTVSLSTEDSPLTNQIEETNELTLSYDQAYFTIKYAALNFINPEKNNYAFKLEGFNDEEWNEVGNQRTATYTNLSAGNYVFKVKASNNDGVWNDQIRTLKIKILPPFWKTWWAYLFYLLIIAGLLYIYYIYSVRTAKLKNDLAFEHQSHEKDQELAQRKLTFFTNISHEIKTPLTLILAPVEKLIELNAGNNLVQNQLVLMQRNGERLVRLINQLLDFRKFESGKIRLRAAKGNMVRFVKEVAMAFDSYAKYLKINLIVDAQSNNIKTYFDRDNFEKIIYNLLSNALKFTPEGGTVRVGVRQEIKDGGEGFVCIFVEDNGKGIPENYINKIFDEFDHSNNDDDNPLGTGIGLAFTKGLVQLHHGSITVQSEEATRINKGFTKFTVKIPLGRKHLSEDEIIENYKNSEDIKLYNLSEGNIGNSLIIEEKKQKFLADAGEEAPIMLIVEDNADVRDFLKNHFEQSFNVQTAENGKIGLEKALELIPDIIISDVMMPEMTGTELCKEIKSNQATSHIPVILLTARTPLIFKIEGLETGADDYITKPFSMKVVETRVWNLLELRRQLRERYRKEISLEPKNIALSSPDERFIEKVMKFIEDNLGEPTLNVEALGKEVGMSRVTLYRKIKGLTNQTTIEIIRNVRIKRAAQLLETKHYNVSEVAYMVGFTDLDYFRKCFKEQFKKTPKDYGNSKEKEV
jgi:signal transduction histidine kinase/ligand-binding sensor domain-containing protein/AraC-like DNA-binding protein